MDPREGVIVVVDANRNKGNLEALEWALKHVVRPRDAIVVLGVLYDLAGKHNNNSCFPLNMGITISGIWERLEFSLSGHGGEVRPRQLGQEIQRKRDQYQICIQPFHRQCRKNQVKLEIKLAAGYCPAKITVDEAQNNSNTRWIVLDSHLKKHKDYIYEHVGCSLAIMKSKDLATLMSLKAPPPPPPPPPPQNSNSPPSWQPLSWRIGFPRPFDLSEVEDMTNGFSDESLIGDLNNVRIYLGILQETPVILKSFLENDERYWSTLMILIRIRHRNIMNLVGYCCNGASRFILTDYACFGSVEANLIGNVHCDRCMSIYI
ncbi:hypothetical protein LWI29_031807 [Acer saccharum]|uniref:non-specific serine/threonine protein kinase n=1 Tax=Acer saccharum TaxID=4024 RepID=A0AA39SGS4_ACESA|nr:hypothetical protein LWI29_031807 [Acer saccharum]